jgi:hypothetical protein
MTATLPVSTEARSPRRVEHPRGRPLSPKGVLSKIILYVVLVAGAIPTLLPLIWLSAAIS